MSCNESLRRNKSKHEGNFAEMNESLIGSFGRRKFDVEDGV